MRTLQLKKLPSNMPIHHHLLCLQTNKIHGFFINLPRISSPSFTPILSDFLHLPLSTWPSFEIKFQVSPRDELSMVHRMIGNYSRKTLFWRSQNSLCIIFIPNLSRYDEVLNEDSNQTRLSEQICLWDSIANSKYWKDAGLIIVVNGMERF